jgi:hypothetical protein
LSNIPTFPIFWGHFLFDHSLTSNINRFKVSNLERHLVNIQKNTLHRFWAIVKNLFPWKLLKRFFIITTYLLLRIFVNNKDWKSLKGSAIYGYLIFTVTLSLFVWNRCKSEVFLSPYFLLCNDSPPDLKEFFLLSYVGCCWIEKAIRSFDRKRLNSFDRKRLNSFVWSKKVEFVRLIEKGWNKSSSWLAFTYCKPEGQYVLKYV